MDDVELQHWMHVAACRAAAAVAAVEALLAASQSRVADKQQDFQVRTVKRQIIEMGHGWKQRNLGLWLPSGNLDVIT